MRRSILPKLGFRSLGTTRLVEVAYVKATTEKRSPDRPDSPLHLRSHDGTKVDSSCRGTLSRMPDDGGRLWLEKDSARIRTIPLGLDLDSFLTSRDKKRVEGPLRILWNPRWEHEKNPEDFFRVLSGLKNQNIPFRLMVCGERNKKIPAVFNDARQMFERNLDHFGYCERRSDYVSLLKRSDVVVSTSRHEFFGISVVEAMAAGCYPLLPNRPSYPEILARRHHCAHLYNDMAELEQRLKSLCLSPESARRVDLSQDMARFCWSHRIDEFDRLLQGVSMSQ